MGRITRGAQLTVLAAVSPAFALVGGWIDERHHLGFTNWRSACRSSGISFASLLSFTLELLPNAIVGALLGGLLVQACAFVMRHDRRRAGACLAAHLGCVLSMPLGLLLCALALPIPLMLIAEIVLAVAAATIIYRFIRSAAYINERAAKGKFSRHRQLA